MASSRPPTSNNADEESRHGLRAYLPTTTDDAPIATRGQHLPALLHSLSYSGSTPRRTSSWRYLTDLAGNKEENSPKKQHATSVRSQRRYSGSSTEDDDGGGMSFGRRVGSAANLSERMLDRRQSNAAITLMTPEMRSQRLIGNSNPRYRW